MKQEEELKKHSTFGIGGKAKYFLEINNKNDLKKAINLYKSKKIPIVILGGGSNILFSDEGLNGIVIKMKNKTITNKDNILNIESGANNQEIYRYSKNINLDFAHFASIPGSIGGALSGNAGIPNLEIKDFFISAEIFNIKEEKFFLADKNLFNFQYRKTDLSTFKERKFIIWSIKVQLQKKDKNEIEKKYKEFIINRKNKQPYGMSGGSFFKNPKNNIAGKLIDECGLKGLKIGNAQISDLHGNFIINNGGATQKDIIDIAKKCYKEVLKKHNIKLENEVKIIDYKGVYKKISEF